MLHRMCGFLWVLVFFYFLGTILLGPKTGFTFPAQKPTTATSTIQLLPSLSQIQTLVCIGIFRPNHTPKEQWQGQPMAHVPGYVWTTCHVVAMYHISNCHENCKECVIFLSVRSSWKSTHHNWHPNNQILNVTRCVTPHETSPW